MTRYVKLCVCLTAALTVAALAQTTDQPEAAGSSVAFVYVSSSTGIDRVCCRLKREAYSGTRVALRRRR